MWRPYSSNPASLLLLCQRTTWFPETNTLAAGSKMYGKCYHGRVNRMVHTDGIYEGFRHELSRYGIGWTDAHPRSCASKHVVLLKICVMVPNFLFPFLKGTSTIKLHCQQFRHHLPPPPPPPSPPPSSFPSSSPQPSCSIFPLGPPSVISHNLRS